MHGESPHAAEMVRKEILIDRCHAIRFAFPIIRVILDDAERVYPQLTYLVRSSDFARMPEGFRQEIQTDSLDVVVNPVSRGFVVELFFP